MQGAAADVVVFEAMVVELDPAALAEPRAQAVVGMLRDTRARSSARQNRPSARSISEATG